MYVVLSVSSIRTHMRDRRKARAPFYGALYSGIGCAPAEVLIVGTPADAIPRGTGRVCALSTSIDTATSSRNGKRLLGLKNPRLLFSLLKLAERQHQCCSFKRQHL
jgi:hypothetical protein